MAKIPFMVFFNVESERGLKYTSLLNGLKERNPELLGKLESVAFRDIKCSCIVT